MAPRFPTGKHFAFVLEVWVVCNTGKNPAHPWSTHQENEQTLRRSCLQQFGPDPWVVGGGGGSGSLEPRCNRTRQRPGPDNDHTIWLFPGPEISGPDNDHLGLDNDQSLCGPEILGPHNDVGKIVWSLSGPETPDIFHCLFPPELSCTTSTQVFISKIQFSFQSGAPPLRRLLPRSRSWICP